METIAGGKESNFSLSKEAVASAQKNDAMFLCWLE